jgi:TonB C terminal
VSTGEFKSSELGVAIGLAVAIELAIGTLLGLAGAGAALTAHEEPPPPVIPIQITPVIEELPTLKYGSKRNENQLPDMWRKPKPKPRYEDKSAASPVADKNPATLPTTELAKSDDKLPPPDAELAKEVDQIPEDLENTPDPNLPEEGAADGVVGGQETDPLKAFIMDQYKAKLIAWFKQGFDPPDGKEFCGITVLVAARVGSDRVVQGFNVSQSSGNAAFDERVRKHLQSKVGGQLPPPPPKYPEFAESTVSPRFSGENSACKDSPVKNKPSSAPDEGSKDPGEAPAPEAPAPEAPAPEAPTPEAPEPEAPAPEAPTPEGLEAPGE